MVENFCQRLLEEERPVTFNQSRYNRGKATQTRFCISIKPSFQLRKSDSKTRQNHKQEMIRRWVKLSVSQYEQLKKLKEKTSKSVSTIIREAVSNFVRKIIPLM